MIRHKIILVLGISFLSWSSAVAQKVVFVHIDGVPADVLEKVATPQLDAIVAAGGYTRAYIGGEKGGYSQTPTISAPGYNTLLTGTWGNKHNVHNNAIKDPNYHYWSLFRFVEEAAPQKKTAVFSTWLDNRTKLIGENLPATGNIKLDYHFDGFENDTVQFPHDAQRLFIHHIDAHVVQEASRYIKAEGPDLSWVYLEYTDDMGHTFGDSEKFYDAVKIADAQMGQLWQAVQFRQEKFKEEWLFIVTTDHGRDSLTGKNHGGQSERERSVWMVIGGAPLNQYAALTKPATVDIAPSILRFMQLDIPRERLGELDGVPLIGQVSLASPQAAAEKGQLRISWKPVLRKGRVKIWLSTTNNFLQGGTDVYVRLKQVPVAAGGATVDISKFPSGFYKVVLEGKHNTVNRWIKH
jgi:hypothetical protein